MQTATISNVKPRSSDDQQCIDEIREVLKKHNRLDRFGICLLHEHFSLEDDEILKESCDQENRILTLNPVKKAMLNNLETIETSWNLATNQPITKCEKYGKCD